MNKITNVNIGLGLTMWIVSSKDINNLFNIRVSFPIKTNIYIMDMFFNGSKKVPKSDLQLIDCQK